MRAKTELLCRSRQRGERLTSGKNDRTHYYLSLGFIITTVLFWGFSFISTKIVLADIPPSTIAFLRQIISIIVLLPWVLHSLRGSGGAQLRAVSWKDFALVALSGMFGIVLYFVFENNGLRYTTAANASMIVAAVPIFTLFTEAAFFKLKITWWMVACLVLSIFGVYLVVSGSGRLDFSSASFKGNMLVMGAMACWVGYTIVNKRLTHKYSSMLLTFSQALVSIFMFIPFIIPEAGQWRVPSGAALGHLIYLGVCCSALGYIFYVYAVKRLGATVTASFLNLIPVITVACGCLLLKETVSMVQMVGMGLILASLYVISFLKSGDRAV